MAEGEKTLAQRWMDLLGEDGFRPRLEVNDEEPERFRIAFKAEGVRCRLYLHEKDPTFFTLSLSFVLGQYASAPDLALLTAANEENWEAKATKVTVSLQDRSASFNIEGFGEGLPSPAILERMIDQCRYSADRFFKRLKETARPVTLAS